MLRSVVTGNNLFEAAALDSLPSTAISRQERQGYERPEPLSPENAGDTGRPPLHDDIGRR